MTSSTRISPAEAHGKMSEGGFTYVDVRTEAEFGAGHPEGSFNVPLMLEGPSGLVENPDFERVMLGAFGKSASLVLGCKAGGRSKKAAARLTGLGFANVLDQRAGWDGARGAFGEITEPGWSRVGLPRGEGQPAGRRYADLRAKL